MEHLKYILWKTKNGMSPYFRIDCSSEDSSESEPDFQKQVGWGTRPGLSWVPSTETYCKAWSYVNSLPHYPSEGKQDRAQQR